MGRKGGGLICEAKPSTEGEELLGVEHPPKKPLQSGVRAGTLLGAIIQLQ